MKNIIESIKAEIESKKTRSAWKRGVKEYAIELIDNLEDDSLCNSNMIKKSLLNGAEDWSQYSWGGCSLCYDSDIAERLCNPSELKKTRYGERNPNSRETWLDVQARALTQACHIITSTIKKIVNH